jgi:hypothetical protein
LDSKSPPAAEYRFSLGAPAGPQFTEAETLKVVMTGSAEDGPEWQKHIRSKEARRKLANRFKDAKEPFRIVIVLEPGHHRAFPRLCPLRCER